MLMLVERPDFTTVYKIPKSPRDRIQSDAKLKPVESIFWLRWALTA